MKQRLEIISSNTIRGHKFQRAVNDFCREKNVNDIHFHVTEQGHYIAFITYFVE